MLEHISASNDYDYVSLTHSLKTHHKTINIGPVGQNTQLASDNDFGLNFSPLGSTGVS